MRARAKNKTTTRPEAAEPSRTLLPPHVAAIFDAHDLMGLLGIKDAKFREMITTGEFPRPDFLIGNLRRWRRETYNEWVETETRKTREARRGGRAS